MPNVIPYPSPITLTHLYLGLFHSLLTHTPCPKDHAALRIDSETPQVVFHCALVWHDLSRHTEAIHSYQRVITLVQQQQQQQQSDPPVPSDASAHVPRVSTPYPREEAPITGKFLVPTLSADLTHANYSLLLDAQLNLASCYGERASATPQRPSYPTSAYGHGKSRRASLKLRQESDLSRALCVYTEIPLEQLEEGQRADVVRSIDFLRREIESRGG